MHYYLALEAFQERDFITAARQAEISGDLWDASFQISRACLLAASAVPGDDRAQVAHELIRELGKQSLRGQNAAYAALARGLIAAVRGDPSARREYENAKSLHATVAPLRVLERRLPSR